ncbi:MAG: hypothetical protein ACRDNF_00035 [Streptosporangiaceae bacterium]
MARLLAFEATHPDITIQRPDYPAGAVMWSAHRDGIVLCAEHELRVLMDRLGWLLKRDPQ